MDLFFEFYQIVLDFFALPEWTRVVDIVKIAAFYVSVMLGFLLLIVFLKARGLLGVGDWRIKIGPAEPSVNRDEVLARWEKIKGRLEAGDENYSKLAIIEADKLFDDLLIRMGYRGMTMGDRLKQITAAQVPSINDVWLAHRLRNELVHNPDEKISHDDAEKVTAIFEKALRDMEVL